MEAEHQRFVVHLIPMSAPQIAITPGGPAVTHSSDFSLVTASKPAAAGRGLISVCYRAWPDRARGRSWAALSVQPAGHRQFAHRGEGEWKFRRGTGCGGFPRRCGRIPGEFSSASGYRKGSGKHSGKRRLDCWNCGADRGSVNVGRTGAERNLACGPERQLFPAPAPLTFSLGIADSGQVSRIGTGDG